MDNRKRQDGICIEWKTAGLVTLKIYTLFLNDGAHSLYSTDKERKCGVKESRCNKLNLFSVHLKYLEYSLKVTVIKIIFMTLLCQLICN